MAEGLKAKSGLLSGNKKYVVIGGGLAAAYLIYKRIKGGSTAATTASTSTTCTCDDGSVPSSAGICADGTTCGAAGSNTAPSGTGAGAGAGSGVGSQGQGMPCVTASGQTGIVDFSGNCVAITAAPVGKGPVKPKPVTCPKGQRNVDGKCTASCPPGYHRLTKTSNCTKTKAKAKPKPKPPEKKPPAKGGGPQPKVATAVGTQDATTTNRPGSGGSLAHGDTA